MSETPITPNDPEFTVFIYETVNPTDHETIGKIIAGINAEEGPLVEIAGGDDEYLRFLRDDAVAQLDLRLHPDDEDILERARFTHNALHGYEAHIRGVT